MSINNMSFTVEIRAPLLQVSKAFLHFLKSVPDDLIQVTNTVLNTIFRMLRYNSLPNSDF